ncbi:MAG: AAA family ATPase [Acidobacteriota bacterium]
MTAAADDDVLPVVAAAELDEPDPARQWLVEGLWPRAGVGIIGGAPKSCKSWLALDLALSVASRTPCLEAFPVAQCAGVLLYMAEDAAAVVKERLRGLCRRRGLDLSSLPIGAIVAPSLRLDCERDQRRLLETVARHAPRLLLLDPFVRLHRINENDAGEVSALLGYLRELQRRHDLAVAVVHHTRKNGSSAGGQSLRGSGDFFAWVDTALSLRRQRQHLVLAIEHRAWRSPPPLTLALAGSETDHAHLAVVQGELSASVEKPGAAATDIDAAVLRALADAPGGALTRAALRSALGVRNQRLGAALARLAATGAIQRRGEAWARATSPPAVAIPVPAS